MQETWTPVHLSRSQKVVGALRRVLGFQCDGDGSQFYYTQFVMQSFLEKYFTSILPCPFHVHSVPSSFPELCSDMNSHLLSFFFLFHVFHRQQFGMAGDASHRTVLLFLGGKPILRSVGRRKEEHRWTPPGEGFPSAQSHELVADQSFRSPGIHGCAAIS